MNERYCPDELIHPDALISSLKETADLLDTQAIVLEELRDLATCTELTLNGDPIEDLPEITFEDGTIAYGKRHDWIPYGDTEHARLDVYKSVKADFYMIKYQSYDTFEFNEELHESVLQTDTFYVDYTDGLIEPKVRHERQGPNHCSITANSAELWDYLVEVLYPSN